MDRSELLRKKTKENKNSHIILVITWHPKLNAIPFILKSKFYQEDFLRQEI